jgi:signal transduction histidine kinase
VVLELGQIAAGVPFAASLAVASGISGLREGRRRTALNEAMHELRRPLQTLSLVADSSEGKAIDPSLRMAGLALERLDRAINGSGSDRGWGRVAPEEVAAAAVARCQPLADRAGCSLRLRWRGGPVDLDGDAAGLSQALDNLINNGLVHGRSEVLVEGCRRHGRLRLVVRDRGTASARRGLDLLSRLGGRHLGIVSRLGGRHRHGHGLRVVRRIAAAHGGSFRLRRGDEGGEAILELPLAKGGR